MLKCPHGSLYHRVQSLYPFKGFLTTDGESIVLSVGQPSATEKRFDEPVFELFQHWEKGQTAVRS